MLDFGSTIGVLISCIICGLIESIEIMLYIRFKADHGIMEKKMKKWNENQRLYPYFNYPFLIRLFFVGLKGAINPALTIFSFILNISVSAMIPLAILVFIGTYEIIAFIFKIVIVVYSIAFFMRIFCFIIFPMKFV